MVLTIQGSIWINFSIPAIEGQGIYFIAYLICSAIQMGIALGRGTVISIMLVVLVLPQILLLCDTFIEKSALNINFAREQKKSEGKVIVSGHVRGYVNGEIDADIQGVITGDAELSVKSIIPGRDATIEAAEHNDREEEAGHEA